MSFGRAIVFAIVLEGLFHITLAVSYPTRALAQAESDTVTVSYEGTSKADSSFEAAREIQAKAVSETAREQAIELIGEKRYQKSKALVESRIVREAAKFIPFVNPPTPVKQPDGTWKAVVELRLSPSSLRKMVLDAGLLNDAEGPAAIVPMVSFINRTTSASTRWWLGEVKDEAHKFLNEQERSFHNLVYKEMSRQGFHLVRPQEMTLSPLPEPLRVERPTQAQLKAIGEFYQAPMAVVGDVRLKESREQSGAYTISVKLQVLQAASGRLIAEVARSFETEGGNFEAVTRRKLSAETPELAKDLAVQVLEAWQRGTLNTNLIRVSLKGQLTPKQLQEFKSGFLKSAREVKSLKERLFEPGQVVFEADLAGDAAALGAKLKAVEMNGLQARLLSSTDQGLVFETQAK